MYTLRYWWFRHGLLIVLASLALGCALYVRQTQGQPIFEMYWLITRPFQLEPTSQEELVNAQILELQAGMEKLELENQQLKALLNYENASKKREILAPIIGRSADHWWKQIILGRGRKDGIKEGFIVTGNGGLVGRVIGVTANTSRVLLISDPSSRVGVTISVNGRSFMGFIRGQGNDTAVMEFFDKMPDIRPGYKVFTSPFSQLFQPGLLVGVVESVDFDKSPAPEAIVKLSAPISHLEWTIVVENQPKLEFKSGDGSLE